VSVPFVSPVASSGSSAQASAPADAVAGTAGDAADNSPFAMLLAAISAAEPDLQSSLQQSSAQQFSVPQSSVQSGAAQSSPVTDAQPPAPQAANTDVANDDSDAVTGPTLGVVQNPSAGPDDITAPKESGKPDKKPIADKSATDATALPVPTPIAAMPLPLISPMAQAAAPTPTVAAKVDGSDISATAIARTSGPLATPPSVALSNGNAGASTPQPVSSEPSQTDGKQASVPQIAANDDGADDNEALNNTEAATQAIQTANAPGVKFSQIRKSASPTAPQAPPPGDDTDADIEPAPNSAANISSLASAQTSQTDPKNAAPAFVAQQAPQKSGTDDKHVPDASGDPQANAVAANDSAQSFQAATADIGSDSKPGHAAAPSQSQANLAQPLPHAAMEAMPQTALALNAAATNAPGGLTLSVHVANHDFDSQTSQQPGAIPDTDALAISVAARSLSGSKQFDIRLDPPELGRVEVRLSIDASGKTQAHMTADQPHTLELLQKDAPNLTRALRDAGLDVSQSGLNFSLKGQSHNQGGQNGNFGAPGRSLSLPAIAQSIEAAQSAGAFPSLSGNARLDIHV
jgi:flagellar hook-length control protein FliK